MRLVGCIWNFKEYTIELIQEVSTDNEDKAMKDLLSNILHSEVQDRYKSH